MFETILVPTDGSEPANKAVAPSPEGKFPASTIFGHEDHTRDVRQFIAEDIMAHTKRPAKERGVENVSDAIEDGDPTEQILRHAETDAANLIVMGSRELSDLTGLLTGSVSHKVSQLSPCTCVTVR